MEITTTPPISSNRLSEFSSDEIKLDNKSKADNGLHRSLVREQLNINPFEKQQEQGETFWDKARNLAEIVCSRESIFRGALDLTGWQLPMLLASTTRNIYNAAETLYQAVYTFTTVMMAPMFTKWVAQFVGKSIMEPEEYKDLEHYMQFQLNELDDMNTFNKGLERIIEEEPEDNMFLAELYQKFPNRSKHYIDKAKSTTNFFKDLNLNQGLLERLRKLKRATIQGESMIEGALWGFLYLSNRLFRKYVLGQDRFIGTLNYTKKEDASKTGDASKLTWWQLVGNLFAMVSSPLMNKFLLNKIEDKEAVEKSPWLKMIKNQWDMTHGVFPKLGLLVSFIMLPVNIGWIISSQGKNELIENLLSFFTLAQSWWFGHRITNGVLAQKADKKLAEKFGIDRGILVEPDYIGHPAPEPAKIQHVLRKVRHNPELERAARDEHAKVLYKGFTLHSSLIFLMKLVINQITKWRVKKEINSPEKL